MRTLILAAALVGGIACASGGMYSSDGTAPVGGVVAGMTDANISAMASVSNQGEISTGRLALERAQDARVRQFAERMVSEHSTGAADAAAAFLAGHRAGA